MDDSLDLIMSSCTDGLDRIEWTQSLVGIKLLPQVQPGDVYPGWRTSSAAAGRGRTNDNDRKDSI